MSLPDANHPQARRRSMVRARRQTAENKTARPTELHAVQIQRGWVTRPVFQSESPGKDKEANWLPAPKGEFNLTMRLYGPKSDALAGKWNLPPVKRMP